MSCEAIKILVTLFCYKMQLLGVSIKWHMLWDGRSFNAKVSHKMTYNFQIYPTLFRNLQPQGVSHNSKNYIV